MNESFRVNLQDEEELSLLNTSEKVEDRDDDSTFREDIARLAKGRTKALYCKALLSYTKLLFWPVLLATLLTLCITYHTKSFKEASVYASTNLKKSPFSGPFADIPLRSRLDKRYQRLTLIALWNNDGYQEYLRHFIYSAQLNADVADLLFVNRKLHDEDKCLDFGSHNIDIQIGGNIKIVCIGPGEWRSLQTDFLCDPRHGWNCTAQQREEVALEFERKFDPHHFNWKPFRGNIYHNYFAHPGNPLWAYVDVDMFIGRLTHFPLNILSGLSMITGKTDSPEDLYLAGQLGAFNKDDPATWSSWKKMKQLKSPEHFTQHLEGEFSFNTITEIHWSAAYMRSDKELPGSELSWAMLPDMQGDDSYENPGEKFVVSGRDVLLVQKSLTREDIEYVLDFERMIRRADENGSVGWSEGYDGSEFMLKDHRITPEQAMAQAGQRAAGTEAPFAGILESVKLQIEGNCSADFMLATYRQCVHHHPTVLMHPSLMRASLVRFKEQEAGYIFRRLEPDTRPRAYVRKLTRHHLGLKHKDWFEFPPFELTEDKVMVYNYQGVEVFQMGQDRERTIFSRRP